MKNEILNDLGEFKIINEIVLPAFEKNKSLLPLGDDCAYLSLPNYPDLLVVTSDPAPKPLVWNLGYESYWVWGWYSVLINVSDIASAGAKPICFTSSVEAPSDMKVEDFKDFFSGLSAACNQFNIPNAGGNIRAAPRFECHGTAIGVVENKNILTRRDCKLDDIIIVIGESGRFISAYLQAKMNGFSSLSQINKDSLTRPIAKLREMMILKELNIVHASSDNSDGILGSLWNIVERSNCAIEIDMNRQLIPKEILELASILNLNPWNLMLFWGDWQVVITIPNEQLDKFQSITKKENIIYSVLGRAIKSEPAIYGVVGTEKKRLKILRNENFITSSYNVNIGEHVDYMLKTSLFDNE
jgi:thiamine-monophosphate kinase